jgi:hypothetical protein
MEIKYAVSERAAVEILRWSSVFLKGDCISQRVTSLYLDTPTLRFFRWHLDGCRDRFKLRVRGYGTQFDDRLYVEVKRKTGSIVRKERAEIPVATLTAALVAENAVTEQVFGGSKSEALHSFLDKRAAFHAEPKMLVRCQRQSLRENSVSGEVAVTIDREIEYQQTSRRDLLSDPLAWRSVSLPARGGSEAAIIELKYFSRPPQWMRTLMARLVPHRVNFSKYKAAMQQHAEWSNGYVQLNKPGMEYARPGLWAVTGAVLVDRPGLYAY